MDYFQTGDDQASERSNEKPRPAASAQLARLSYLSSLRLVSKLRRNPRENRRTFNLYGVEGPRIQAQASQYRGCDLHGDRWIRHCLWREAWISKQQHHVGIVMGETAVISQRRAGGNVGHAEVGCDEYVRRPRIVARF